jgi:hypothetical protein
MELSDQPIVSCRAAFFGQKYNQYVKDARSQQYNQANTVPYNQANHIGAPAQIQRMSSHYGRATDDND